MKHVRIRYCKVWNYLPRAARVAALIEKDAGGSVELIEGKRGEFTVWVGEELVAEKSAHGFPSDQDAVAAVRRALGN